MGSNKSASQEAIDSVVSWVPDMLDAMVESVSKGGGWPGMQEVSGKQMLDMYQAADPQQKVELYGRMSPEEQEAVKALYTRGLY